MPKTKRPDGYHTWQGMIQRCEYAGHVDFHNYGGRGVRVCQRWRLSFAAFMEDMGPRPSTRHSIDRFPDPAGNYEPGNCRWATMKEQQNNKRNNRIFTFQGRTMTMAQWADEIGITIYALYQRLAHGRMSVEEALTYRPNLIEHNGKSLSACDWAKIVPVRAGTILKRIRDGWTPEEALTTPVRDWGR